MAKFELLVWARGDYPIHCEFYGKTPEMDEGDVLTDIGNYLSTAGDEFATFTMKTGRVSVRCSAVTAIKVTKIEVDKGDSDG